LTTQTLKEADRYLLNNGFVCEALTDLGGGEFRARYELGILMSPAPKGIAITLRDYGNRQWTFHEVAHSANMKEKAQEVMDSLRRLPGFEPQRI
jgi:hypothetical protein